MRTLLLVGMFGIADLVARRVGREEPRVVQAAPACVAVVSPPVRGAVVEPARPELEPEPEREPEADDDGEDLGVLMAQAQHRVAELQPDHNAIVGTVTDERSGEALAGVAVIATSPQLAGTQTAITDERGAYALTGLPAGSYLVTFCYGEVAREHAGVTVSSLASTPLVERLDQAASDRDPAVPDGGITVDRDYIVNIPVGRTFEAVLGEAADEDHADIAITGTESTESTIEIDGFDLDDSQSRE